MIVKFGTVEFGFPPSVKFDSLSLSQYACFPSPDDEKELITAMFVLETQPSVILGPPLAMPMTMPSRATTTVTSPVRSPMGTTPW